MERLAGCPAHSGTAMQGRQHRQHRRWWSASQSAKHSGSRAGGPGDPQLQVPPLCSPCLHSTGLLCATNRIHGVSSETVSEDAVASLLPFSPYLGDFRAGEVSCHPVEGPLWQGTGIASGNRNLPQAGVNLETGPPGCR